MPLTGDANAMNVSQLKKFCLSLPGARERLLGEPANILVYSLGENSSAELHETRPNCNDSAPKRVW